MTQQHSPAKPPKSLRKEAVYDHPIETVWAALTNPEAIAQWLMPNNFEPVVGRDFEFRVDPTPVYAGLVRCSVLELAPPTRMVWSWRTTSRKGKPLEPMRLEWSLTAESAARTRLVLVQTGLEHQPKIFNLMMSMGWGTMLNRWLPKVLLAFESTAQGLQYQRIAKAPNRGHHKAKTVPPEFHK